jgi:hypothetical protein
MHRELGAVHGPLGTTEPRRARTGKVGAAHRDDVACDVARWARLTRKEIDLALFD